MLFATAQPCPLWNPPTPLPQPLRYPQPELFTRSDYGVKWLISQPLPQHYRLLTYEQVPLEE